MNGKDIVYRTIVIKGTSEGLDKLQADLNKVAAAHKGVTLATEETEKSSHALEQAMKRQTLRLDETARSLNNIARETKLADSLLKNKLIDDTRHAELLSLANQRYGTASKATQEFGKQTGLARHELINLGRQAQDVGVSLASGQSPFMVLVQQGSQIADVFATSAGGLRGFFTQAIGWAGRFVFSLGGVATAVLGVAASAIYMATQFASAQKEIDKALAGGGGAASGATRGGINRIAEQAAGGGMSIAEARQAATAFAATGKIYEENIARATSATRDFALVMGIDAAEATKRLAAALVDPSKGALDLQKAIAFLDVTTLEHIRTLQTHGRLQEAQAVMMNALAPAIATQVEKVGLLTRAWNSVNASIEKYNEESAKQGRRAFEKVTGVPVGGFTDEERLDAARERQRTAGERAGRGVPFARREFEAATKEVEKFTKALEDAAERSIDAGFTQLAEDAKKFSESVVPSIGQVNQLTEALATMREAQDLGLGGPNLDAAIAAAQMQLQIVQETAAAEQRRTEALRGLAEIYPGMSIEVAKQLNDLQGQLYIAQARTGAERLTAQQLVTQNALLLQGKTLEEAMAVAAAQRALAEAQINAAADQRLKDLQNEYELIKASSAEEKGRIRARQEYNRLVNEGVDSFKASNIAAQMQANARATEDAADATESWSVQMDNANDAINRTTNSVRVLTSSVDGLSAAFRNYNIVSGVEGRLSGMNTQFEGTVGEFTYDPLGNQQRYKTLVDIYGAENVEWKKYGQGVMSFERPQLKEGAKSKTAVELEAKMAEMNEALNANTEATRDNTQTMTDVLSPFYSSDPRRTHLGFRSFAGGGIMTPYGELPLRHYQGGGVATSPQVAVYGEGSTPEAYVPVPAGRIPVEIRQPANSNLRPVNVTINVMGNADGNTVAALKATAFQQAQAMRRAMA